MTELPSGIGALFVALEARRRRFLAYYYAGILGAVLLSATAWANPEIVLAFLQRLSLHRHAVTHADIVAYRGVTLFLSIFLVISPLYQYSHGAAARLLAAVNRYMLACYGAFRYWPAGALSSADVETLLGGRPVYFTPGAGAMLQEGAGVRFCEAFWRKENGEQFSGTVILWETPDTPASRPEDAAQRLSLVPPSGDAHWDERITDALSDALERMFRGFGEWRRRELAEETSYRLRADKAVREATLARKSLNRPTVREVVSAHQQWLLLENLTPFFRFGSLFLPVTPARALAMDAVMQMIGRRAPLI